MGGSGSEGSRKGKVSPSDLGANEVVRTVPDTEPSATDAETRPANHDQPGSDADQTASDADQTASDADQDASEQDDVDSRLEQQAADADQERADHQWAVGSYEAEHAGDASRAARKKAKAHRDATHAARAGASDDRASTSGDRDATAAARDETARRRDVRAAELDQAVTESDASLAEKLEEIRVRAAADRARAAADRERAARDRAEATRERARLEQELNRAHLDELTGAFGRELGRAELAKGIDRARRGDGRFVVAFVDVDGMKRINDVDGHAAGDRVLQTVVSTMRANMRSFDPIVRYGGDEFVCGMGGADLEIVERRFDAIGRSVQDDIGVGISVGLASLGDEETLDQLTARADATLLDLKKRYDAR